MMKKTKQIRLLWILPLLLGMGISAAGQQTTLPIPSGDQIVVMMRGSQAAKDRDLQAYLLGNPAVSRYLNLLNISLADIDRLTIFMPFDPQWFTDKPDQISPALPQDGAFIISGKFDSAKKIQLFKSKGWKKKSYANKKVLWWSSGTDYYRNPKSGECIGLLPGQGLMVAGSSECMNDVLDVAGGKVAGLTDNTTYESIFQNFDTDNSRLASVFFIVTPQIRELIKAQGANIKSAMARSALSYVDYLKESGFSITKGGAGYILDGYLGIDSENNAMIAASVLQLGGGLASFVPDESPLHGILENMIITRQGRIVNMRSGVSRQQLMELLQQHK